MAKLKNRFYEPVEKVKFALHPKYRAEKIYEEELMGYVENEDFESISKYIERVDSLLYGNSQLLKNQNQSEFVKNDQQQARDMSRSLCYVVYEGLNNTQLNWLRSCLDEKVINAVKQPENNNFDLYKSLMPMVCDRIVDDAVKGDDTTSVISGLKDTEISMTMYIASLRLAQATTFGKDGASILNEITIYQSIAQGINQNFGTPIPQFDLTEILFPKYPESLDLPNIASNCQT